MSAIYQKKLGSPLALFLNVKMVHSNLPLSNLGVMNQAPCLEPRSAWVGADSVPGLCLLLYEIRQPNLAQMLFIIETNSNQNSVSYVVVADGA